jgi:hypothetical protein
LFLLYYISLHLYLYDINKEKGVKMRAIHLVESVNKFRRMQNRKRRIVEYVLSLDNVLHNDQKLRLIKDLEREKYPSGMRTLQTVDPNDEEELLDYFEVDDKDKVSIHFGDNDEWYAILSRLPNNVLEVVDLAGDLGENIIYKLTEMLKPYINWTIKGSFRVATSYRLIKLLERRGHIDILEQENDSFGNEPFKNVTFKFTDKFKADQGVK